MSAIAREHPDNPERWEHPDLAGAPRCPKCGHLDLAHSRDPQIGCSHRADELSPYCRCTHYAKKEVLL